jgi:hypothetical protein
MLNEILGVIAGPGNIVLKTKKAGLKEFTSEPK